MMACVGEETNGPSRAWKIELGGAHARTHGEQGR